MQNNNPEITFAKCAIKLLQGPVFEDQQDLWNDLTNLEVELKKYFDRIFIDVIIDKRDGYAFLTQRKIDDEGSTIGLMRRTLLTYEVSLVLVLLREWMMEFESADLENVNLYISPKEFRDRLEMFFKEQANEFKFVRELNKYIQDCVEMGFLKLVNKDSSNPEEYKYEVKRIIKARVTNDELLHFKELLENEFNTLQH